MKEALSKAMACRVPAPSASTECERLCVNINNTPLGVDREQRPRAVFFYDGP